MPRVANFISTPLAQSAHGNGPFASAISSQMMSRCKLSSGSNDRQCLKPSRKDHHVSSQGLSENFLKMIRHDALSHAAKQLEESHLNFQHVLEFWTQRLRASRRPNAALIRDCGPNNCIE